MIIYLNPFYLERKFESLIEREFVHVLWAFLMPNKLYVHISGEANMKTLNKIRIKYQDGKDIMIAFLFNDPSNIIILSDFLEKNAILYQFLFGNLFPKCFSRINDYGIRAKTLFNTYYHNFHVQKNMINWSKEENLQSPLNMTTLNDSDNNNNNDDNDENKENIEIKKEKEEEKNEKKKVKRKIKNDERKREKREAKKQRLLEQLNENTEKLKKLKKKK